MQLRYAVSMSKDTFILNLVCTVQVQNVFRYISFIDIHVKSKPLGLFIFVLSTYFVKLNKILDRKVVTLASVIKLGYAFSQDLLRLISNSIRLITERRI